MKTIGLFYAMNAAKTSHIAEKIREDLGGVKVIEVVLIEKAWQNDFQAYDNMIVGASTWFDGELPTYWDELVPELESLDLKGKKVAIFGLGDAEGIIVLERNNQGKVTFRKGKKAGCIEEKLIREGICEIMEGGEDAFRKRERKYQYN